MPSIALSAILLVAIVFAAISADTILPFTMLAETTEFAANWSAPIESFGITGICVNVTTPFDAIDIASSSDVCPICVPLIFISSTVRVVSVPNSVTPVKVFGTTKSIVPSES